MLSWELLREGCTVLVVDNAQRNTSSRTACGLINPVTGKRHVKSWRFDELMMQATNSYRTLGSELGLQLLKEYLLLHFFKDGEEEKVFEERVQQGSEHLYFLDDATVWQHFFQFDKRVGVVQPCYLLSLPVLLEAYRNKLKQASALLEEDFDWQQVRLEKGKAHYKDISATKIVCCEGVSVRSQPYFGLLPFSLNKGEALIVSIPGLPNDYLYLNRYKIAPWRDGLFWVGSTFDWNYADVHPSASFRKKVTATLEQWLQLPFEIVDHLAAERPSSPDYHPYLGLHPQHPELAVFNGQGTKGCSQTPLFAKQMKDLLIYQKTTDIEVNIARLFQKKK